MRPLFSMRELEAELGMDRRSIQGLARSAPRKYNRFDIIQAPKRRHIDNPDDDLKEIQRRITALIIRRIEFPETIVGGISGRSVKDNADFHKNKPVIATIDLKDCFSNTSNKQVFDAFRKHLPCSPSIARLLTQLTTIHGRLPQGAPSSPAIANLTLFDLHDDLQRLASDNNCACTFYVDDITLSGSAADKVLIKAIQLIHSHQRLINSRKISVMRRSRDLQVVTGTQVNNGISALSEHRKKATSEIFRLSLQASRDSSEVRSLFGLIYHIRYINEAQGNRLLRLANSRGLINSPHGDTKPKKTNSVPCTSFRRHRRRSGSRTRIGSKAR